MSSSPIAQALLERPLSGPLAGRLQRPEQPDAIVFDPRQPRAAHEALLALAASPRPAGLIEHWTALAAADPASAGETWFQATRLLGRTLDVAALDIWIDATRKTAQSLSKDKLRVERYADLFTVAYENELRRWRHGGIVPRRVQEVSPPTVALAAPPAGGLMAALALVPEANAQAACKLVLQQAAPPRSPRIPLDLRLLRDSQLALLGWSEFMLPAPPPAELLLLPNVRFAHFGFDNRGAIVFDGDKIASILSNEHYMLDMTGHVALTGMPAAHEALAFAPVSACPLNHYHELMDTLGSMAFYALMPPGTPVIVPKRYDVLRPLYEAAGIDWSLVREYAEVSGTVFGQVVAPVQDASRSTYAGFLRAAAARLAPDAPQRRRFYLSRAKVRNRPLDNEDEIERIVQAHGFEILHVQDVDVIEACRLMAQAEIVLGPHGAAFGNIVFAPENTLVIEMLSPDYKAPTVFEMAADAGLCHLPLVGSGFTHHPGNEQSWRMDAALVADTLSRATDPGRAARDAEAAPPADLPPEALRDLLLDHARMRRTREAVPVLQALLAVHPAAGVDGWFAATRLLGRGLDPHAMRFWMEQTKEAVVAQAPDKLRVERYGYLYRDAVAWELESWADPNSGRLAPVQVGDATPPRHEIGEPLPGSLIAHRRGSDAQVLTVPARPLPEPAEMGPALSRFRARQMALLGLAADHARPSPPAELFVLPEARFTTFTADDRGGIVFSGDVVAPQLCNEHYMLDMIGHYRPAPVRRRVPLAFAPVSACPLNHYHELMDTFSSLAFCEWLPKNTPIVVPKRYEILRPIYEAAGIDWSLVQDYAQVADAVFEIVVAPREGSSRSYLRPFVERVFHRNVVLPRRNRRLYLSRRGVPERVLDNEAEIESMAQRHGFEIVHVQTMSALEQAKLAASAEIILAPHGAALSNILFARDGTTVIEIMPRDYVVPAVLELARDCRLGWLPVAGSSFRDTHSTAKHWTVDPALVEEAVSLAIEGLPRQGSGWRRTFG